MVAELDLDALGIHLQATLPGGIAGPLSATLVGGGRSNPTYRLADGENVWVLRRPPYGHVLPSAHDMKREYTVIDALAGSRFRYLSRCICARTCMSSGAPFYLMELVDGGSVGTVSQAEALTSAGQRHRLGLDLADTLADLHDIDPASVGLSEFGRPEGYLERQLNRWERQWASSKTSERSEVSALLGKLSRALPALDSQASFTATSSSTTCWCSRGPARIVAVLDWEMSTWATLSPM